MRHSTEVLSWKELVGLEPGLGEMLADIQQIRSRRRCFCGDAIWYQLFKPRLRTLVGYEAHTSVRHLRTKEAYDVAYRTLYEAIPECRGHAICSWNDPHTVQNVADVRRSLLSKRTG